jgi:poly(3-hydroxybutyrate) depolymerase
MKLPVTAVRYCVKAADACKTAGAKCPLYVTINTNGAFFDRVADPPAIAVELYTETDGTGIKDKLAELPRVIAKDYAGLDSARIYAIGWSAGAGAVNRGLCHVAKKSDFSMLGTTSDIYAAVVGMGGCGCANDYAPLAPKWHILTWNGMNDPFNGGDSCEAGLRKRASVNGCSKLDATWQPVAKDDAFAQNADGSAHAEKLDFGECAGGAVIGYRFADEGHVVSAKTHFDPKISGYDTIWRFLQGKTK